MLVLICHLPIDLRVPSIGIIRCPVLGIVTHRKHKGGGFFEAINNPINIDTETSDGGPYIRVIIGYIVYEKTKP